MQAEIVVSINLLVPGLDVRPPVQKDLDGLQVALLSSIEESGRPTLSDVYTLWSIVHEILINDDAK